MRVSKLKDILQTKKEKVFFITRIYQNYFSNNQYLSHAKIKCYLCIYMENYLENLKRIVLWTLFLRRKTIFANIGRQNTIVCECFMREKTWNVVKNKNLYKINFLYFKHKQKDDTSNQSTLETIEEGISDVLFAGVNTPELSGFWAGLGYGRHCTALVAERRCETCYWHGLRKHVIGMGT